MGVLLEVCTPDLNGPDPAPVVEIPVTVGDAVQAGDHLITVETEKAAIEIPSPYTGVVKEILVELQEEVTEGKALIKIESENDSRVEVLQGTEVPEGNLSTQVVVLGSGPGGYSSAFRAADLGMKVVLVERHDSPWGCLPEYRLYPFQVIAACGQGVKRYERDAQSGDTFFLGGTGCTRTAQLEGQRNQPVEPGSQYPCEKAEGDRGSG